MSIFDVGKMCTFSKISGVILNNGEPVTHAQVIRETDYEKKFTDQTTTDENGYFEMPALFVRSIAKYLPQEFVVGQLIKVVIGDREEQIWSGVKRTIDENAESRGKPLVVSCDLANEKQSFRVDGSLFTGKCQWDVEPDKDDYSEWKLFSDE
ncbi:carboxypeptidase-like regulatory domain-containing protein [Endozoicomonas numazuensis]|uniref:DUF6795 domain-containing protein n=1 Tax=Endozoicomonas numazuensis TaxID=1137799 RepID=UPI00126951CB|nr:carboxypeptidase-like regulatory domain-containing protein [Endozoicomonas numazuensis]